MSQENNYKFPKNTGVTAEGDIINFFDTLTNKPGLALLNNKDAKAAAGLLVQSLPGEIEDDCFKVIPNEGEELPFTHVLYSHNTNGSFTVSLMDERVEEVDQRVIGKFVYRIHPYLDNQVSNFYRVEGSDFAKAHPDYKLKKYIVGDVSIYNQGNNLGMLLLYLVDIYAAKKDAYRLSIDLADNGYITSTLSLMRHKLYMVPNQITSGSSAICYDPKDILV